MHIHNSIFIVAFGTLPLFIFYLNLLCALEAEKSGTVGAFFRLKDQQVAVFAKEVFKVLFFEFSGLKIIELDFLHFRIVYHYFNTFNF